VILDYKVTNHIDIAVEISSFQAGYEGSIPFTRSNMKSGGVQGSLKNIVFYGFCWVLASMDVQGFLLKSMFKSG
jgi:hypothetical protein